MEPPNDCRASVAGPGTACTETYLVARHLGSEIEAANREKYLRTRFRWLSCLITQATQHATRDIYSCVPDLPLNRERTDANLYKRYG